MFVNIERDMEETMEFLNKARQKPKLKTVENSHF